MSVDPAAIPTPAPLNLKKRKNARAKKDPNAPKRPRSAYILFCSKIRPDVKKQNPDWGPAEIMKRLGEMWRDLTTEERKKYSGESERDKERYSSAMESYEAPDGYLPDGRPKAGPGRKGKKDPTAPRKARSPYVLFCQEQRTQIKTEHPEWAPSTVMKRLGEMWRDLTSEQRNKYGEEAVADKQRYDEELKIYEPGPDYNADGTAKLPVAVSKPKKKKRDPNEPKRGLSAYIFFGQDKRDAVKAAHPDAQSPAIMQIIGQMWRDLPEEQKRPYMEKAANDRLRYERERLQYEKNPTFHDDELGSDSDSGSGSYSSGSESPRPTPAQ